MAVVVVWGANTYVSISNLTIAGPFTIESCAADLFGVAVLSGGSVSISGDSVENIRNAHSGIRVVGDGVTAHIAARAA